MVKQICPSSKRKAERSLERADPQYYKIVTDEMVSHTRCGYLEPHEYWDYLHSSAKGEWHPCFAQEFDYLLPGRPYRATGVVIERREDAAKFQLTFGGTQVDPFGTEHKEELETYRRIQSMLRMSREERRSQYRGLDEIILSASLRRTK